MSEGDLVDDRFRIQEVLGMGGAGITYRCTDEAGGSDVALKHLHTDRKSGVLGHRLAIEGEVLELLDHPHIVPFRCFKVGATGPCYLATVFQSGGSLEARIRRDGPLPPQDVLAIGRQLALALEFVHAGGIVHRDLKPGNVLLEHPAGTPPVVRLADFGIARIFRSARPDMGITRTGAFIGTPEYAAPEQIRGEKGVGPAADAFALGALLHYAASGRALLSRREIVDWDAFRARDRNPSERPRLADEVEAPEALDLLELLDRVVDSLMSAAPAARMTLADAALALGALQRDLPPEDGPRLHPPTLVSMHGDWSEQDEPEELGDLDALVPDLQASGFADETAATIPNLAGIPVEEPAEQPLSAAETEPSRRVVGSPMPIVHSVTSVNPASDGRGDDDVLWPPRSVRRRRFALRLGVLGASLLVGFAIASPGGPAGVLGAERVATLPAPVQRAIAAMSPAPEFAPEPRDGPPSFEASSEEIEAALHEPIEYRLVQEKKTPKKTLPKPKLSPNSKSNARWKRTSSSKPKAKKALEAPLSARRPRTKPSRSTPFTAPTRTARPIPRPDRPDVLREVPYLSEEEIALMRDQGALLAGRIERERRAADELARKRVMEASKDSARVARVQRRIDRVLQRVRSEREHRPEGNEAVRPH